MRNKLKFLADYGWSSRRVGHTTAMIDGAKSTNATVIALNGAHATVLEQMGIDRRNILTTSDLEHIRAFSKPLAIDHYALQHLIYQQINDTEYNTCTKIIEELEGQSHFECMDGEVNLISREMAIHLVKEIRGDI